MTRPDRARYDVVVRAGVVLVALGSLAAAVTLLPLVTGSGAMPVGVYLLSFLAPLGLGVILVALWHRARTRAARLRRGPAPTEQTAVGAPADPAGGR